MSGVMEWLHESLHDNLSLQVYHGLVWFYCGLTPQQQPGSYQGGEMMMKSVFWWRKPEYPEETTDCVSWSDCHGVTKLNWLGNQHDKFTYYHSCHVHLLRGPLRVTSVGSCLNAMPSGSTGGTSRSWQVINLTFAERAQTWQLLFPWASQLLFFTGKDLVTKWQNKGKVAVTHAILYVPVSPGQTFRHGVTWTCRTMLPWASHQGQSSRDTHFQSTCVVQFIYNANKLKCT